MAAKGQGKKGKATLSVEVPVEPTVEDEDHRRAGLVQTAVGEGDKKRVAAMATLWKYPEVVGGDESFINSPLPFSERSVRTPKPPPTAGQGKVIADLLNVADHWQRTPLLLAARRGDADIVAILLSNGADPVPRGRHGVTPVAAAAPISPTAAPRGASTDWVANASNLDVARILLSFPAVITAYRSPEYSRDDFGDTVLHHCVRAGNVDLARDVLAFGIGDANAANNKGQTPRDLITDSRMREVFEAAAVSAERAAAIKSVDNYPGGLRRAVEMGDHYAIRRLVELGVSLGEVVSLDAPVMMTPRAVAAAAAFAWGSRVVDAVVATGAAPAAAQVSPTHIAAAAGDVVTLALLLSLGASPSQIAGDEIPLSLAVRGGHRAAARLLLAQPATDTYFSGHITPKFRTILGVAAKAGNLELVELLLLWGRYWDRPAAIEEAKRWDVRTAITAQMESEATAKDWVELPSGAECAEGVCTVCTLPPPNPSDTIAYACPHCKVQYCTDCAVHLAKCAINEGKYPMCCNAACNKPFKRDDLLPLLSVADQMMCIAMAINETVAVDKTYRECCAVCNRVNDLEPAIRESRLRYQCAHCAVYLCAVCHQIFPGSDADKLMHKACMPKLQSMSNFARFQKLIMDKAQRVCPSCGQGGVKDSACSHMSCNCGGSWCWGCGVAAGNLPGGMSLGEHGEYSGVWMENPMMCPMYIAHLCKVDPRVRSAGCGGENNCDNHNNNCTQANCKPMRDQRGNAILSTMRVRHHITEFVKEIGMAAFEDMVAQFGWRELVDNNFFENRFPWGTPEASLPDTYSYEPEEVRKFYKDRPKFLGP